MERHFHFRDWELKERLFKRSEIQTICDDLARAVRQDGQHFILDTAHGQLPYPIKGSFFMTADKCAKRNYDKIIKGAKKRGLAVHHEWSPTTDEEYPMESPFYVFS